LPKARELAAEELAGKHPRRRATSVRALFRIGEPSDRHALREAALAEARRTSRGGPVSEKVWWALSVECPDEATEFGRGMSEQRSQAPDYMVYEPTLPVDREPLLPRTVPRLSLVESSGDAPPRTGPRARFGGQPDWLSTPAWPLASDGRPLTFYGQLPLLGEPARMAYIFISVARNAETWAPLGDGNAVVIQPGPPPHLATREWATGPQLFSVGPIEWGFREPPSRFQAVDHPVELQPGADPAEWTWPELGSHEYIADEQRAWNKIGGTPSWLQGPQLPPGDGWQFAFQFTAAWAGEEMGDGAECYGFVRDDGTGAFLWQCH
jgi:hypothetical protein